MMEGLWIVLCFCCFCQLCVAQTFRPQIANPKFAMNNPTLSTIALEKPFCVFDDLMSKGASYKIYLYVTVDSARPSRLYVTDNSSRALNTTFQETNGGKNGTYKAAAMNVPNCASLPKLFDATDVTLAQYLVRVGNDTDCLYNPNYLEDCNPPLSEDTAYRFKYVLVDQATGVVKDQTLWSHPIKTRKLKQSSTIDTWPGRRSGGMIVITSILSVLMLVLVAGFLVAVLQATVMTSEEIAAEIKYVSQTTHQSIPRPQETLEPET